MRPSLIPAVVVALVLSSSTAAAQQGPSDEQLEDARRGVGVAEAEVEANERAADEAEAALAAVDDRLRVVGDALAIAEGEARLAGDAAEAARLASEAADDRLDRARAALAAQEDELADFARGSFMYGPRSSTPAFALVDGMRERRKPTDLADGLHLVQRVVGDYGRIIEDAERLRGETDHLADLAAVAEDQREADLAVADASRDVASERHAEMLDLLEQASATYAEREAAVAAAETTREQAVGELRGLETARAEAEAQARREAAERAAREQAERERAEREAAEREAAEREASEREAAAAAPSTTVSVQTSGSLATVGGITVAASLAPSLKALLEDARADGIVLGGGGYRSPKVQERLRIINGCPDVYTSPSSSCRVPTAIPGRSMHERGLAIDFTYQGRTICFPRPPRNCHGNAGFDWLQANASRYGLYGLSTEAWHYSTNGN